MPNPFVHIELSTTDLPKAKAFYGSLFGWKLEDVPMGEGTYTMIGVGDDGVGGGMMQVPMAGMPSAWLAYVAVDDIAKSTAKAASSRGSGDERHHRDPGHGLVQRARRPDRCADRSVADEELTAAGYHFATRSSANSTRQSLPGGTTAS